MDLSYLDNNQTRFMKEQTTKRLAKQLEEKKDRLILSKIEDILLDFARLNDNLTNSDLQGIATAEAKKILKLIK